MLKLAHWYQKVEVCGFKNFNVVLNSITVNYQSVLNYFDKRSTNASTESFNAKIKGFRSHFKAVQKIDFSYSDYQTFLDNPQVLRLIHFNPKIKVPRIFPISIDKRR